ncbi:MAG: insulinase family protein [Bacteroidales bacterium]|nr:insulinase family protein [Bacteroidales bacterium]
MKTLRLLYAIILSGFIFQVSIAQTPGQDKAIPPDPNIKIGRLDNGLTYYIKQNTKPEQRMEMRLAINAGSICETDAQQGLAHFCEHMCFNGTKNFPSNKMVSMLEEMGVKFGAELNAFTSFDQTVYMLKVPTDSIEWINRGFQVIEDWAHEVSMENTEIDKERGVIEEEWRMGLGADDRMQAKYIPVILKGSKYAERIPIGKMDIIKSFPYDTLRKFYSSWYRPDLMAVVVVGDIDPVLAESKIKEHFGRIPKAINPPVRVEFPVPDNSEPLISIVTDKEASGFNATVFFKHPAAENITFGDYRNQLMRTLYTGMLNNRLQEIGQKPESPFIYAGAGYGSFIGRSVDVYSLSVGAKENQIENSLDVVLTENERVRQFGFTATELDREKKDLLSMYEKMAKESDKTESDSYADEYIRNYLDRECIPGIQKEFEITSGYLPDITLEEINSLGKTWTTDKNMVALITAQEKEGVRVPTEEKVKEIIMGVKSKKIETYVDAVSDVPLLEALPVASKVVKRYDDKKFGYTELTFANGVRMLLKSTDFKNDEIVLSAYSPGGTSLYPDSDIMSANLATAIITQSGLGDYDFTGLQKKLSGNTARLSPYINELNEGVSGACSPKDIETMLQLNYLYFTKIRRDENAYNGLISKIRNMIKPMRSNPQVIFQDTLSKIISLNSPRVIGVPSEAQIDQVNLDRSVNIFRDRFADASDFTYLMAGNFKIDEVIPLLEKYIGGLPSIKRKETWKDVTPGFPKGLVNVDVPKNSEPQSSVAMVWKGDFKWNDKDRLGFTMLMNILAIKCRESMREDQGGVYGVSINGSASKFPRSKYTIQSTWGCSPENIEKLSKTVLDEMGKIKKDGPAEIDLNKVKETLIRERETKLKENGFWLSLLQNHLITGDKLQTFDEYQNRINSYSLADIKSVANKYLNTQNYVQVSLSPATKAEIK